MICVFDCLLLARDAFFRRCERLVLAELLAPLDNVEAALAQVAHRQRLDLARQPRVPVVPVRGDVLVALRGFRRVPFAQRALFAHIFSIRRKMLMKRFLPRFLDAIRNNYEMVRVVDGKSFGDGSFIFLENMKIRKQNRLRREYLYKKSLEAQERQIYERKQRLKTALAGPSMFSFSIIEKSLNSTRICSM